MLVDRTPDYDSLPMYSEEENEDMREVKWRVSYSAQRRLLQQTTDFGLGLAGAVTAFASIAFAMVMMTGSIGSSAFGDSEYFLLFTRPLRPVSSPPLIAARPADPSVDFAATGSIGSPPKAAEGRPDVSVITQSYGAPRPQLKDYSLRSVRGGVATISGPMGRFVVESGTILPNGDRVISIDRRAGRWVVVTSSGLIEDQ